MFVSIGTPVARSAGVSWSMTVPSVSGRIVNEYNTVAIALPATSEASTVTVTVAPHGKSAAGLYSTVVRSGVPPICSFPLTSVPFTVT